MPTYNPLVVEGHRFGLNIRTKPHALMPGECVAAENVDFSQNSERKRNGTVPVMLGEVDNAIRGPAPGTSCYVHGTDHGIEFPEAITEGPGSDTPLAGAPLLANAHTRFDFHHHRHGCIVIAPDDMDQIQCLEPQTGNPIWAVEFLLWTDNIPFLKTDKSAATPAQLNFVQILASKSQGSAHQWDLIAIPDTTSVNRVALALVVYTGGNVANPNYFFYSQGNERAWLEPGKKTWISFIWDGVNHVRTKYWKDGNNTVLDSDQVVPGPLLAAGNAGAGACPIVIGRKAHLQNRDAGTRAREMGWNGCITEMRFWDSNLSGGAGSLPPRWGIVSADPPAANDWYVDRELEDFQLSTIDAGSTASYDLKLVYQFKHDLVGTTNVGVALPDNASRIIRARYRNPAAPADKAAAWLTGADATWIPGGTKLGEFALGIVPAAPTAAWENTYNNGLKTDDITHYEGFKTHIAGVRIPNGRAYLTANNLLTSTNTSLAWPKGFSVRTTVRPKAAGFLSTEVQTIWQMCAARKGVPAGAVDEGDYSVVPVLELAMAFNGGLWKFRWTVLDGAGAPTVLWSTNAITLGQEYTLLTATRWETINGADSSTTTLYIDGALDQTNTGASTRPFLSQATDSETSSFTDENDNDLDGRDTIYPMSLGFSSATAQFDTAAPVNPFSTRFGSQKGNLGSPTYGDRNYWAHHNNKTIKSPNDGVPYRGQDVLIGDIGDLQIWSKCLSESEARSFASRPPNASETKAYGKDLLSNWKFDEGTGTLLKDSGSLKNHVRFNPLPLVSFQTGAIRRTARPPILGLWQLRSGSVNSSLAPKRNVFALAGGNVHQMLLDDAGDGYLESVGRCVTPELYNPTQLTPRLPTAFQFNEMLYICTGLGAVKRVTNGQLYDAGLTPVFGNIGDDQTNLGWREFDRDGTFNVFGQALFAADPGNFEQDGTTGWMMTYYDPVAGIESAPSRIMYFNTHTLDSTLADTGWKKAWLQFLPHSPQANATKIRLYRTTKNGLPLLFMDEVDATTTYVDSHSDFQLGSPCNSWLNYPPPQNARLGIAFGARAVYAGVAEDPGTIFYSLLGQPGAVPPQYRITVPDEVTALFPLNDRVLVCTRRGIYALFDTGGDVSFQGLENPPMQLSELRKDIGCLGHHTGQLVEGIGWVFLGERGLYATNGQEFRYISERVEPLFRAMALSRAHAFTAVLNKRRDQYILFYNDDCVSDGRNDRAIVWDWVRDAFSTMSDIMAVSTAIVEDTDTGIDRVWLGDWSGQVFEFDPPDRDITNGGLLSGPKTGTVIATKLDVKGSGKYTRFNITDNEDLPTDGAGLRGVRLNIVNGDLPWNEVPMIVVANDNSTVEVESLEAGVTDPTGYTWQLGAYAMDWKTGQMDFGNPGTLKVASKAIIKYGQAGGDTLNATAQWDENPLQTFTMNPAHEIDPIAPILGRGRKLQLGFTDRSAGAPSGVADNAVEITAIEVDWRQRGRSSYVGS
jgi:hypothetical protein